MQKEIVWILLLGAAVLTMFAATMLLDFLEEIRHQREARHAFRKWMLYRRARNEGVR